MGFALTGHMPCVTGAQDHPYHLRKKGTSVLSHWVACTILHNSLSVFLQLGKIKQKQHINSRKNEERGRKSYLVPKIRKVKSSLENPMGRPTPVCFQSRTALATGPFLCPLSACVQPPASHRCHHRLCIPLEWCSAGSLSLKMPLWPGLMTVSKDLLVGTYLSSGEKQTVALKPMYGHLLPLTLQGLCL